MDEDLTEARRLQIEIIRSWTPEQRLKKALQMMTFAIAMRNARILPAIQNQDRGLKHWCRSMP